MRKLLLDEEDGDVMFYCPGCDVRHVVPTGSGKPPRWTYNGNQEQPTLQPSVKIQGCDSKGNKYCCHFFIIEGNFQYCSDCTHPLAGKIIEMGEI